MPVVEIRKDPEKLTNEVNHLVRHASLDALSHVLFSKFRCIGRTGRCPQLARFDDPNQFSLHCEARGAARGKVARHG